MVLRGETWHGSNIESRLPVSLQPDLAGLEGIPCSYSEEGFPLPIISSMMLAGRKSEKLYLERGRQMVFSMVVLRSAAGVCIQQVG